jgi:hypothetical protein
MCHFEVSLKVYGLSYELLDVPCRKIAKKEIAVIIGIFRQLPLISTLEQRYIYLRVHHYVWTARKLGQFADITSHLGKPFIVRTENDPRRQG